MKRGVRPGETWSTFKFDGKDCAEFGVYATSSGGTYSHSLTPNNEGVTNTTQCYDGNYYFGEAIDSQTFNFNMFAENLTNEELRRMKAWLKPGRCGKLIMSQMPYKYYWVRIASLSELNAIPLSQFQSPKQSILGDFLKGEPVFTGDFQISFETIGSPYGYLISYYKDELEDNPDLMYINGLLYKDELPIDHWSLDENNNIMYAYNPGEISAKPKFKITNEATFGDGETLTFYNNNTEEYSIVDVNGLTAPLLIDFEDETIIENYETENEKKYYGRISGIGISLKPNETPIELPCKVVRIKDHQLDETTGYTISNNVVDINNDYMNTDIITDNYNLVCTNFNGGVTFEKVDNLLYLNGNTPDMDENGFEFNYIGEYDDLDDLINRAEAQTGNVGYTTDNNYWYVYMNNEWHRTKWFGSENEFYDPYGDFTSVKLALNLAILECNEIQLENNTQIQNINIELLFQTRYI